MSGLSHIPVSSRIHTASWPRPGVPQYVFTVRSYGGAGVGVDLREYDWTLQVDSRRALRSLEYFRSDADIPGTPIGVFRQRVEDGSLCEFDRILAAANLGGMHPVLKRHAGNTQRLYTLAREGHAPVHLTVNDQDFETNATLTPLHARINSWLSESLQHPEHAVKLGIAESRLSEVDVLEVSITNIGLERVCFTDPRWIASAGPLHRAAVMIAPLPELRPGESPLLDWREILLEPLNPQPKDEPLIWLESGGVWETIVSCKRADQLQVAYFTWANFAGAPTVSDVYRIRGRADSPRLVIEP